MVAAGRMEVGEAIGYIVSQVVGAIIGAFVLTVILSRRPVPFDLAASGLGQNGWGPGYLGAYGMSAAIMVEVIATFLFTAVILGVTQAKSAGTHGIAGLIIGLTLFALHLPFIQVTGLSVNPARSLGPAVLVGGQALQQVWLFLVAPIVGGAVAGWLFRGRVLSAD
jgi:aquaporin Z